ncbi:MAG TPA: SpoIIE family protein phosphatase [Pyrinomonadaceae bacterium]|jgi:serine phosphatase RsbU (regulator of sigma subunit)
MKNYFLPQMVLAFAILALAPIFAAAQDAAATEPLVIAKDSFSNNQNVSIDRRKWKYRAGDDFQWAAADLDDSGWDELETSSINRQSPPPGGWNGRGWFRLRFQVDESMANQPVSLEARQFGASEVYLNGRLVTKFGEIKERGEIEYNPAFIPVPVEFRAGENVLAVRYSASVLAETDTLRAAWLRNGDIRPGFYIQFDDIDDFKTTIQAYSDVVAGRFAVFYTGVLTALGLLHLLMFLFYRVERANLFYSLHAFAFAAHLVCINNFAYGHWGTIQNLIFSSMNALLVGVLFVSLLAFLHVAFERRFGKMFWLLAGAWALGIAINVVLLRAFVWLPALTSLVTLVTFVFCIYLLIRALKEKRPGAWILMGGVLLFAVALTITLLSVNRILPLSYAYYPYLEVFIVLSIPVAVSIFLALHFARTSRNLSERLTEVRELSARQIEQERREAELRAENERRTKELEEARQLQISMLPKKLPQIAGLEIAAYMKPATEVGGDYYDFHVSSDGTLTVAVGDATGHGLKAGTLVSVTKGLFNNLAHAPDISGTLNQMSRSLKMMNLRGLFMALTLLRFKDNDLLISVAGMPSVLIYRAATRKVDELSLRALPLGSVARSRYSEQRFSLASGDVVLLMSDGFPEMFNETGEMLGFEKAAEVLPEIAHHAPQEIIDRLVRIGHEWAGSRPQDDDVTFVVLKTV